MCEVSLILCKSIERYGGAYLCPLAFIGFQKARSLQKKDKSAYVSKITNFLQKCYNLAGSNKFIAKMQIIWSYALQINVYLSLI